MKYIKTFFSLLAIVTLLAGCVLLDGPENMISSGKNGTKLAKVNVDIKNSYARTILPSFDWNFSKYVLSAAPYGGNTEKAPPSVTIGGTENEGSIYVPYGDWTITITAYVNIGGTDYPAAKGSVQLSVWEDKWIVIPVNIPDSDGLGTFTYKVTYPSDGTASVKLQSITSELTLSPLFDDIVSSSGTIVSKNIASGMYFLTVTVTANGTVIRSEIVHIYNQLTSNADYVFTKLDFGAASLQLGGTINVKVNGVQPDSAQLQLSFNRDDNWWNGENTNINFSGNGNGTWNLNLNNNNIPVDANKLYFRVRAYINGNNVIINKSEIIKQLVEIPLPVDDKLNYDLGNINFAINTTPESLTPNTWKDGEITEKFGNDWYSIDVTAGTTYYLWWNDKWWGDNTKNFDVTVYAWDSNGNEVNLSNNYDAWNDPSSFTASLNGEVFIRVNGYPGDPGTYAIAYSTDHSWFNNSYTAPVNPTSLAEGELVNGSIDTSYGVKWYSMDVNAGETYYLKFNDKTLDIDVYLWDDDGNAVYLSNHDNVWWEWFTAVSTGKIYARVRAWAGNDWTGTYAIMYELYTYEYNRLGNQPYNGLVTTGSDNTNPDYKIISLPNGQEIMKVDGNGSGYAVVQYPMYEYKDKYVRIYMSAKVKRKGASGDLLWQINKVNNSNDYPIVSRIDNAEPGYWYSMGGSWEGTLTDDYPHFYLSTYENNSDQTVYYIQDFYIYIKEELPPGAIEYTNNSGGNQQLPGSPYGYEMWTEGGNNNKLIWYGPDVRGGAAFRAEWNEPNDFLGRVGYFWGNGGLFTEYKNMYADFAYTRSGVNTAGGYSYIGIYGWARDPGAAAPDEQLIEYYIVEDWFGNQGQPDTDPMGTGTTGGSVVGSYELDGATYSVIKNVRTGPSIDGDNTTFTQYFSIRQTLRKSGTISITEHFKEWDELDMPLGNMYEAKFLVEAGGGTGWLEFSNLVFSQEDTPRQ
jgi:endo-1,4-beta-xylanase